MSEPWVIVSAGFHSAGGQAKAVAGLAAYVARTGRRVHLVGHDIDPALAAPNVVTHAVRRPLGADALGNVLLARAGRAVARAVTRSDPHARVVVNGGNCPWADVNWVHYLHAAFTPDLTAAPRWFRGKERIVGGWYRRREGVAVRAARLVLANSRRTAADVVRYAGVPAGRVRTVYYGADASWAPASPEERRHGRELFGLHPERPVVAFVGGFGFDNRKGFDTLLTAWEQVARDPGWDADLVLAGGGKAAAGVAARLGERVRMIGFTDRVFDLLAASDLLISPVRYEPYGLNVQEAICRGVPAVVSAVAGVAEEYPPELAEVVLRNADDAGELAARLRAWRADPAGWRRRFAPLSARLRSRTWEDMAREIDAAVQSVPPVIDGRPGGR